MKKRGMFCNRIRSTSKEPHRPVETGEKKKWTLLAWILASIAVSIAGWRLVWAQPAQVSFSEDVLQHTSVGQPFERTGHFVDETDGETEMSLKWNRFAIHDPPSSLEVRAKQKSPEQKAKEDLAVMAITQSEAFLRAKQELEAKKTPEQKAEEDQAKERAKRAVERPREMAQELEKTKDPATRRREEIATRAILFPREFNEEVERHKGAALKEREAEIIRAWSQPKAFMEERFKLKKTGGIKASDRAAGPPPRRPQGVKEKGQIHRAGGSQ